MRVSLRFLQCADEFFHLGCRVLRHSVADVSVGVEREGDGCVPKGQGKRLKVDFALNGKRGIGVANIVKANFRAIELADQRLEMNIQRLETDEHAVVTVRLGQADAADSASPWLASMLPSQMARDESCCGCEVMRNAVHVQSRTEE